MRARLELEDGTVFSGFSCGAKRAGAGEVVFNTSMVGYPESLTDPSYKGQILTFTFPLIGNYGVHEKDIDVWGLPEKFESDTLHPAGVVFSAAPHDYAHWHATKSLDAWLKEHNIPGIYGIDTRALTKKLREHGVLLGRIIPENEETIPFDNPNTRNLVEEVSTQDVKTYGAGDTHIVLIDCGVKYSIIRSLLKRNARVTLVPWNHDVSKMSFDGLVISNGPGDPALMQTTIDTIKRVMHQEKPIFGICLGHQLLARAAGASTYKLKYGHRSHNQPCVSGNRCYITSQNHGFAVDQATLPNEFEPFFTNANDGTNEGIKHKTKPFFSVQFHPESCGGPLDAGWLFDDFLALVQKEKLLLLEEKT